MKKTLFISISIIIALAVASAFAIVLMNRETIKPVAEIYSEGKLLYSIDLNSVAEPYVITVTDENGGMNVIEVRKGEIGVIHADCFDKTCINMGFTGRSAIRIVCLPHKLEIKIIDGQAQLDGVSR